LLGPSAVPCRAGTLEARVVDASGAPVAEAVVSLPDAPAGARRSPGTAVMDQRDKRFVPQVLAVRRGTEVRFPNNDDIRHQVYSFSPAKVFDLPLYHGTTAEPVTFDQAGVAVLGCNIHDWMVGYVVVLDTPWFASTGDDGRADLDGLPAGSYTVEVWHPRLLEPVRRRVEIPTPGAARVSLTVRLAADDERRRLEALTPLERRFKRFRDEDS
jgi:plastocyanin